MKQKISFFRCTNGSCDCELSEYEIDMYDVYEGMCEACYQSAMNAAYEDLPDIFGINRDCRLWK